MVFLICIGNRSLHRLCSTICLEPHPLDSCKYKLRKIMKRSTIGRKISEKEEYEKVKWRQYKRSYMQAVNAYVWFYSPVSNKVESEHIACVATGHGTESFFLVRVTYVCRPLPSHGSPIRISNTSEASREPEQQYIK
jgi:hypothetical protein